MTFPKMVAYRRAAKRRRRRRILRLNKDQGRWFARFECQQKYVSSYFYRMSEEVNSRLSDSYKVFFFFNRCNTLYTCLISITIGPLLIIKTVAVLRSIVLQSYTPLLQKYACSQMHLKFKPSLRKKRSAIFTTPAPKNTLIPKYQNNIQKQHLSVKANLRVLSLRRLK